MPIGLGSGLGLWVWMLVFDIQCGGSMQPEINIDALLEAVRRCVEARIREGYGYGSLTVTVTAYPINSEPQPRDFDARDYE